MQVVIVDGHYRGEGEMCRGERRQTITTIIITVLLQCGCGLEFTSTHVHSVQNIMFTCTTNSKLKACHLVCSQPPGTPAR